MSSDEDYRSDSGEVPQRDRASEPTGDEVARATAAGDGEMVYADTERADEGWLGQGAGVSLLVGGFVLFLFPEPATSMIGIFLMAAGLAVWAADAKRRDRI